MTVLDIDAMLEPVRTAPSEGDALRALLRAQTTALQAIKRLLGGVGPFEKDSPAAVKSRVEAIGNEIDKLLSDMMLDSPKVEATMKDARSKRPVDPSPMELHEQAEQKVKR